MVPVQLVMNSDLYNKTHCQNWQSHCRVFRLSCLAVPLLPVLGCYKEVPSSSMASLPHMDGQVSVIGAVLWDSSSVGYMLGMKHLFCSLPDMKVEVAL